MVTYLGYRQHGLQFHISSECSTYKGVHWSRSTCVINIMKAANDEKELKGPVRVFEDLDEGFIERMLVKSCGESAISREKLFK